VDERTLRDAILRSYRLRIEPEMTRYALRRLAEGSAKFPLLGGDARTGVPARAVVTSSSLAPDLRPLTAQDS
jgi:hypothetical protein